MLRPTLTDSQAALLIALLTADRNARARAGEGDRFAWHTSGGMGPTILIHRGAEPEQTIDRTDMEALISLGLLERIGQRAAVLTPSGFELGGAIEREQASQVPVDVTWSAAEPVLNAVWAEWTRLGAPSLGVPTELIAESLESDVPPVARLLDLLGQNGWVEMRAPGDLRGSRSTYCPTARAMQRLGGWPVPEEAAVERFLAAVDAAVEETDDEEEKGRLRALRDAALRVGEGTLTGVLTRIATGQLPL